MNDNLEIFRKDYLNANTWAQRKDGVPLDLLDALTKDELKIAESELINSASLKDTWQIIGLGHIKSTNSLSKLYGLLSNANSYMRIVIAHSIFQICKDKTMIEIVLNEASELTNEEIINVLYMFPDFKDSKTDELLRKFCESKSYLVAYNATRTLGLSTDEVVKKFCNK